MVVGALDASAGCLVRVVMPHTGGLVHLLHAGKDLTKTLSSASTHLLVFAPSNYSHSHYYTVLPI